VHTYLNENSSSVKPVSLPLRPLPLRLPLPLPVRRRAFRAW
jgi:hypothetical protein